MAEGEGISLVHSVTIVSGDNMVLIDRALPHAWHKAFPNPGLPSRAQRLAVAAPTVEIAHDENPLSVGCPHSKISPRHTVCRQRMGPKLLVKPVMASLVEEVDVIVRQESYLSRHRAPPCRGESSLTPS